MSVSHAFQDTLAHHARHLLGAEAQRDGRHNIDVVGSVTQGLDSVVEIANGLAEASSSLESMKI